MALRALPCVMLAACVPDETLGISNLDTISQADRDNAAWFDSFYGRNHCLWGGCQHEESKGGTGGGFWAGGVGPSDSGGASDSGN